MEKELDSIKRNDVWELSLLSKGKKIIKSKWIFKQKNDEEGKLSEFKVRLVAKGCSQTYGLDFNDTSSPVVSTRRSDY